MTSAHSSWSASGFEAIMLCPGKKVLEAGLPDRTSEYAAEGTAAHQVLTWALQDDRDAVAYLGRVIQADGFTFTVDDDMAQHVQVCIDYVKDVAGDHGVILVDRKVNYSTYLDVPAADAWGTLDVTILLPDEIVVIDFKYGRGVEVSAGENVEHSQANLGQWVFKPNPQLALYGLGALQEFGDLGDFQRVRLVISQPRISVKPSEYDLTMAELEAWGNSTARSAVASCKNAAEGYPVSQTDIREAWESVYLRPNEKSCKFCRAKATCPALRDTVTETITAGRTAATPDEFAEVYPAPLDSVNNEDMAGEDGALWLSVCLDKVDLIEDWCKAVRAEVERRMLAGETVPGFKLVEGKQGNRAWTDEKAVEAEMKSMRLKLEEMYDFKLISPTSAEKLAPRKAKTSPKGGAIAEGVKTPIGPRQWTKLQTLIQRAPAKKHVAPLSDPRPALVVTPADEDFDVVTTDPVTDLA